MKVTLHWADNLVSVCSLKADCGHWTLPDRALYGRCTACDYRLLCFWDNGALMCPACTSPLDCEWVVLDAKMVSAEEARRLRLAEGAGGAKP